MRTQQIKSFLLKNKFAIKEDFLQGIINTVNAGVEKVEVANDVSPSHSLEIRDNIAIITVDGAMTKKNTWINAMCGGFASYDILFGYIDKAEKDVNVDTIVFNIDTPGGMVDGVDEIGEKIYNSKKRTITYYNNLGASAGIWAFSSSKEIYANQTAELGSIGVVLTYLEDNEENNQVTILSKRAENKRGRGVEAWQEKINEIENIFYSRVTRNTGLSSEQIENGFNKGETITAQAAQELGFIQGITTFDKLISSLEKKENISIAVKAEEKNVAKHGKQENDPKKCYNETRKQEKGVFTMTLQEFKESNSELYTQVFNLGAESEKDRINAHIVMSKETGANEFALECIENGATLTQSVVAKYQTFAMNKQSVQARTDDNVQDFNSKESNTDTRDIEVASALADQLHISKDILGVK